MTTTEEQTFVMTVEYLDPRELSVHPRNVRTDLGDLDGLAASIAAQGVIEPITVVPVTDLGHYLIVAGHRRVAAAIVAGLERVPCIVRTDLPVDGDLNQAAHVGAMLAENIHRAGLSAVEEARGVQAMLDLGVPISKVAKQTGLGQSRVKKALGVSRLDDDVAAAVTANQLDLEQAAAIALYADEPALAAELVTEAGRGPGFLAHALGRAKKDRDARKAADKLRAALTDAGRAVVDDFEHTGSRNRMVSGLLDAAGDPLDADAHVTCPGSAVYIRTDWSGTTTASEVCTAPFDNGHRDRYGSTSVASSAAETPAEKEAAAAERRTVILNNKLMAAANTVRRAWLKEFLARRTAPKELLRFAVEAIADRPYAMHTWLSGSGTQEGEDAVRELGLTRPSRWVKSEPSLTNGDQVPDARLPLQLFAHVAAAVEGGIAKDSWRVKADRDREHLVTWLTFLAGQGYPLADVEQQILDGAS